MFWSKSCFCIINQKWSWNAFISGKITCYSKIYSQSASTKTSTSNEPKKPGRGAINEKATTPSTIKRQKRKLFYEKVHMEKEIQHKDLVSSTRSSAAKVWQQMTLQMKVTRMVQRVSQHLWRTMKILSLEISKTRRLIWHMYVVLHESNWYLYVIGTAIRSTYCCTWS